jgi:transcriptional regulator with GAF, ATPase, and Fis domain
LQISAGNLRDLQRLAALLMAWGTASEGGIQAALQEWEKWGKEAGLKDPVQIAQDAAFGHGTRDARLHQFRARLANWAKGQYGTWKQAAKVLGCDEKTLREDEKLDRGG